MGARLTIAMLSIKAKQVAGVTSLVAVLVVVLSGLHLASLARVSLHETSSRADMLARAIFQRAREVVPAAAAPYAALRADPGIRSLLESSIAYSKNVTYAAIADSSGTAVAHSFPGLEGRPIAPQDDLRVLQRRGPSTQLRAIYSDRTFEVSQPLLFGDRDFGAIRIGVSTLLIRSDLQDASQQAIGTALAALVISTVVAMLLAQWLLRPIHVIKSGLSRLGRGEFGVTLDLPPGDEFGELGRSFNAVSAQLSAVRSQPPGQPPEGRSAAESLEDAVAVFGPEGELFFANSAMRDMLPEAERGRRVSAWLRSGHPCRSLIEQTLATRRAQGPVSTALPGHAPGDADHGAERLMVTHVIEDRDRRFMGAMLLARNVGYLSQVQSTINYSRKLAALGRLLAGVAHEVKNPLNAMTIHLELLKQKLSSAPARRARSTPQPVGAGGIGADSEEPTPPDVMKHVTIIADEIKRLDEVVLGFLKFARPDELRLEPIQLSSLIDEVVRIIEPEADGCRVSVKAECPHDLPHINGDTGMLQQALLNLALNACQAMPHGGTLRMACRTAPGRRVELTAEDTGIGIDSAHLARIFDLYFTTKERGSGIGLSMVYRIVQLHDGEIEVQSTPGHGTRFRILLPQA
ncbi:MAG: HAMP domain-containing protein [Acidobacteria bacterium]|nr:HAMP domain-containing protein [Acidobacteriota bacterium]